LQCLETGIVADLTASNPAGAGPGRIWELKIQLELDLGRILGSQNNTPDEINGVNNADRSYKVAVQFSASFIKSVCHFSAKFAKRQWILYFCRPSNAN